MHYFFEHFGETGKHSFGSMVGQVIFFTSFKYGHYFCSFWMTSIYIFWKSNLKTMFQKIMNFTEEISGNKTNIIIPCTYFQREKSSFWCINKKLLIWYIELFPWSIFQIHDLTQDFYEQVLVLCLLAICFDWNSCFYFL